MNKTKHIYNWSTASVDPIVGSSFFTKAVELIDTAQQSVSICIFTARYYRGQSRNPINALFDSLRRAAQRGVSVQILLNQNFYDQGHIGNAPTSHSDGNGITRLDPIGKGQLRQFLTNCPRNILESWGIEMLVD